MVQLIEGARIDKRLMLGFLAALGAAICYGAVTMLARKVTVEFAPPLVSSAYALGFGLPLFFLIFYRDLPRAREVPRRAVFFLLAAGIMAGVGVSSLYIAVSRAPVVTVAPIIGANPLVTLFLSYIVLRRLERITPRLILGTLLTVTGVVLVIIGR